MCFIFTQEALPSNTLLVLSPVELEVANVGTQSWQLTYVNNVNPSTPSALNSFNFAKNGAKSMSSATSLNPSTFGRTSFAPPAPPVFGCSALTKNTDNQMGLQKISQGTLMCVPIPNKVGMREEDFLLCAIDPDETNRVRSSASMAFKPFHKEQPAATFGGGFGFGAGLAQPQLTVQQVGAYRVCVAPTYQDFHDRAPWSAFNIEDSYRNTILNGMQQVYGQGFAFVIAAADSNAVKNSGFSVVYCNDNPYIPTAHEITAQDGQGLVEMDATVIAFNTIIDTSAVCTDEQNRPPSAPGTKLLLYPKYRCDDSHCRSLPRRWSHCVDILSALPCVGAGAFHQHTLLRHARPICCVSWDLKGKMRNGDVCGRIANSDDQQTLMDAMAQLDYWWVARLNGFVPRPRTSSSIFDGGDISVWGGRVIDFILALVGRKIAHPSIQDRFSDSDPHADVSSEIFINLDFAAERGIEYTVDIDRANFSTRRDHFLRMQDGSSAENSIYFRLAATKLPPEFRTTKSRTTMGTSGWVRDLSFTRNQSNSHSPGFTIH